MKLYLGLYNKLSSNALNNLIEKLICETRFTDQLHWGVGDEARGK